jgi:hypothetical protein
MVDGADLLACSHTILSPACLCQHAMRVSVWCQSAA